MCSYLGPQCSDLTSFQKYLTEQRYIFGKQVDAGYAVCNALAPQTTQAEQNVRIFAENPFFRMLNLIYSMNMFAVLPPWENILWISELQKSRIFQ